MGRMRLLLLIKPRLKHLTIVLGFSFLGFLFLTTVSSFIFLRISVGDDLDLGDIEAIFDPALLLRLRTLKRLLLKMK